MSRKYLIAGNWKMNKNHSEATELADAIVSEMGNQTDVGIVVCPPFTALSSVAYSLENSSVRLGAQNMHSKNSGAFTGEISIEMLKSHFVSYVILGHSERRAYFGETNSFINEKVKTALEYKLNPILCVGETLEDRETGQTAQVIRTQLLESLAGIPTEIAEPLVVAYEPVWAIGTGKTATPEMAQDVHARIRMLLQERFNESVANKVRILYGGSMKAENALSLLAQVDIDGGLIGGAALDARSFLKIVEIARERSLISS